MFYSYDELRTFARNLKAGKYGRMPTLVMGDPGIGMTWAFTEVFGLFRPDVFRMDPNRYPLHCEGVKGGSVFLTGTFTAPHLFARVQLDRYREYLVVDDGP